MSTDHVATPATSTEAAPSSPTADESPEDTTPAPHEHIHRAALERIEAISQQWRQLAGEVTGRREQE